MRRLRKENRRLTVIANTLETVNEDLRDTVRMDEALLGFGQQEDAG
jgi:hypothetical protein